MHGCKACVCIGHWAASLSWCSRNHNRFRKGLLAVRGADYVTCSQGIFHSFKQTLHSAVFTVTYWKMKSLHNWMYPRSMTNTHRFVPSNYEQFYRCANSAGYWLKAIELVPKQTVLVVPSHYWSCSTGSSFLHSYSSVYCSFSPISPPVEMFSSFIL